MAFLHNRKTPRLRSLEVRLSALNIGADSIEAENDGESSTLSEVIPAVAQSDEIEALVQTSPEMQREAVNVLMEEEAAIYAKKKTLSPHELRKEGHVQYDLKVESVSDGAIPSMKVVRLKSTKPMLSKGGQRFLTKGVYVLILGQHEDPKDRAGRKPAANSPRHARGMISAVGPDYYDVVVEKGMEKTLPSGSLQIEGSEMLQVYKRMLQTISEYQLAAKGTGDVPLLADIVRGRAPVKVSMDTRVDNSGLNPSQRQAIAYALGSNLCLIKGPPGTGKTMVLYETILELLERNETVLICCGSHTAVDNLVERLHGQPDKFLVARLGHPHKISASTRHNSVQVQRAGNSRLRQTRGGAQTKVVAATLHAAYDLATYEPIHTVVIDEACQALQAQSWIPLINNKQAKRLIIAGDDKQLPPTITTQDKKASATFDVSLFEVLTACYGNKIIHLLDTQYRMSEPIMRFPSDYMYDGLLKAAPRVASQKLYHVGGVTRSRVTTPSVLWIDTSSLKYTELAGARGLISNPTEAALVKDHCLNLQRQGVLLSDIGVISPYVHQKNLIKDMLPAVEVNTIDGYQGQEKNVIVLSLVRSNGAAMVGFLSDERRMNVALTRAKYQLCVVGDMMTIERSKSPFLKQWVAWCRENATIFTPDTNAAS